MHHIRVYPIVTSVNDEYHQLHISDPKTFSKWLR